MGWHGCYLRALVLKSIMEAFFHLRKTLPRVLYYIFVLLTHNQINSVLIEPNDEKKAQKTFSMNFPKQLLQVCTG